MMQEKWQSIPSEDQITNTHKRKGMHVKENTPESYNEEITWLLFENTEETKLLLKRTIEGLWFDGNSLFSKSEAT